MCGSNNNHSAPFQGILKIDRNSVSHRNNSNIDKIVHPSVSYSTTTDLCVPLSSSTVHSTVPPSSTTWFSTAEDEFLSEPTYISKTRSLHNYDTSVDNEDNGYLLCLMSKTSILESYLLIFHAKDIERGPIVRVKLPVYVGYGLHGNFIHS